MPQDLSCCIGQKHDAAATIQSIALPCFAGTSIKMTADQEMLATCAGNSTATPAFFFPELRIIFSGVAYVLTPLGE